jgi:hippurate hydrolase
MGDRLTPAPDAHFSTAGDFDQIVRSATRIRHELHRHPERTWQEHDTAERIRSELTRIGLTPRPCAGTGTIVDLGPENGARIALRADIDALPITEASGVDHASTTSGVMHACGHDGHTASLLATAAWLKVQEGKLTQGVRLLFQPAEEGGHGAKKMIEDGCLHSVEVIYGYHNLPTFPSGKFACPVGPVMVSNGYFRARIVGQGGHASTPEACRDPIQAAAQFVTLAQQIVARNVPPQKAAVVTVATFHAGSARNAIPDEAILEGTIRAAETDLRDALAKRLEQVLGGVCAAAGVEPDFLFQPAYQATVNHAHPAHELGRALEQEFGQQGKHTEGVPFMGGEDFSYYLAEIPGAYALVGSGTSDSSPPLHSPRYDFNDALIPTMVRVWSRLVGAPLPPEPNG